MHLVPPVQYEKNRTLRLSLLSLFLAGTLISGAVPFLQLVIIGLSIYFLSRKFFGVILAVAMLEGIATGQIQTLIRFVFLWFEMTPPSRHLGLVTVLGAGFVNASMFPFALGARFRLIMRKRMNLPWKL